MVSAMAATTVSAKEAGKSNIQQYDIVWNYGVDQVIGKLTLSVATGH